MEHRTTNRRIQDEWTRCDCPDCLLPDEGPPEDLYQKAVPIWHGSSIEELEDDDEIARIGYVKAFASGMEVGLIMANLRPEWARAYYLNLRSYYLTTHTQEDLEDWEDHAKELCDAIPMVNDIGLSPVAQVRQTMLK